MAEHTACSENHMVEKYIYINVFEENLIAVLTNLLMLFTVVSHSGFQELQLGMTSDRSQRISHTHQQTTH